MKDDNMNIRIQLRLIKDNLFKVIVFWIMSIVTSFLVILAVTGLGNYRELKEYFPESMNNLYIYSFDSYLYDLNHSNGYGVAAVGYNDYSDIMNERINLFRERFDVTEVVYPDSGLFLHYKDDSEDYISIKAYNYNNPILRDVSIKIKEGRLPDKGETNVMLLPSYYKAFFKVNEEYDINVGSFFDGVTDEEPHVKVKVIGFFENPYCFNPDDLSLEMHETEGIIYLSDEVRPPVNNSRTVFIKTDSEIPEEEINALMIELKEAGDSFRKYDPDYEYKGEIYGVDDAIDKTQRQILISFGLLFVVVFADTYLGLKKSERFMLTIMKLGCSRKSAITNIIGYKFLITILGIISGTLIYKYYCLVEGVGYVGGIDLAAFSWSLKYVITADLMVLAVCLIAHIPYILKVTRIDIHREE